MTHAEEAKQIIADNIYMTIATTSPAGTPWVSPVFFAYDDAYNLYWVSEKTSRHSKYIHNNENVAIVIFDSSADEGAGNAVYVEGRAHVLEDPDDIDHGIQIFDGRAAEDKFKVKSAENVTGDAVWRMYRAQPTQIYYLTDGEYVNGQYVDRRAEVHIL